MSKEPAYRVIWDGDNLKRYKVVGPVVLDGWYLSRKSAEKQCALVNAVHEAALRQIDMVTFEAQVKVWGPDNKRVGVHNRCVISVPKSVLAEGHNVIDIRGIVTYQKG